MSISSGSAFIAVVMLVTTMAIIPQHASAQTPQQMEYERQQREYRQQMERQQQEQQRQQQIMNENARRQQEESSRFNAPIGQNPGTDSQGAAPQTAPIGRIPGTGSQGAAPQMAPRQAIAHTDATAATAGAKWVTIGNHTMNGGVDIYAAPSTIRRTGHLARMWDMWDFKSAQQAAGKRFVSFKQQNEYNCKDERIRTVTVTGFSGHMGKGSVVDSGTPSAAWNSVDRDTPMDRLRKLACGKQ
jgi:hypothetical protein